MAEQTNLPSIPPPNENNLVAFARAVKEALEVRLGRRGQGLDAMVTFRDLDKVQMVLGDGRGGVLGLKPPAGNGGGAVDPDYDPTTDMLPPPAPQNVKASGAVRNVILEWDGPPSTYRNHAYAEVWRSSTNNLNDAAQIGQSGSTMYVDNVGEGQARYYWVRFVSQADVTGPWHAAGDAGEQAVTALDVGYTLGLLTANGFGDPNSGSPFVHLDAPVTVNGVEVPAGTYVHQAWVANGTITNAKIGNAAIDDAKVANLSAAKLTAGDGTIGGILKSAAYISGVTGWAIHRDGWAEFANATVRGTVYADTGWFKGQIIGGNATTYASGTGMWTGVDAGTWKFRLGSSGTYLRWDGESLTLRGTLTIEDGDGNVLLSSGVGVPWGRISGKTGFASISQITPSNVTTYIADAALGNAQIGGDIYSAGWSHVGAGSGWYLQRSGNFYGNNIYARGDIEASSLKANTLMVKNANIEDLSVSGRKIGAAVVVTQTFAAAQTINFNSLFGRRPLVAVMSVSQSGGGSFNTFAGGAAISVASDGTFSITNTTTVVVWAGGDPQPYAAVITFGYV